MQMHREQKSKLAKVLQHVQVANIQSYLSKNQLILTTEGHDFQHCRRLHLEVQS